MIYYFSGTGNSRWVARERARLTGDEAADIAPLMEGKACIRPITAGPGERIGLVFPIYAWGAPKIVNEFVYSVSVSADAYPFAVCTCGDEAGLAMDKLRRRYPWKAAWSVIMPNNYIPMYEVDGPELANSKVESARARLPEIAARINSRADANDIFRGKNALIKSTVVNAFFNAAAMSTEPFFTEDSCTSCGECERLCPRRAITLSNGRPVWTKPHCQQCMACIQRCPVHAIQYGEQTRGRGRYCFREE